VIQQSSSTSYYNYPCTGSTKQNLLTYVMLQQFQTQLYALVIYKHEKGCHSSDTALVHFSCENLYRSSNQSCGRSPDGWIQNSVPKRIAGKLSIPQLVTMKSGIASSDFCLSTHTKHRTS